MVPLGKVGAVLGLLFCFAQGAGLASDASANPRPTVSLYAQSAARVLRNEVVNQDVSYLLLDAESGALVASNWDHAGAPIPLGSLMKPFAAIAYGEHHGYRYPKYVCRGEATGCWRPRGHGTVNMTEAIAYSCNSYFRALTSTMSAGDMDRIAMEYGLEAPPRPAAGTALWGLGDSWAVAPLHEARAYLELVRRREQPGITDIVEGMRQSGRSGTGQEVSRELGLRDALVKTGTARCTHAKRAPGDGFAVALVPADDPQILLLVRVHGVPGAQAAKVAGEMLRSLER